MQKRSPKRASFATSRVKVTDQVDQRLRLVAMGRMPAIRHLDDLRLRDTARNPAYLFERAVFVIDTLHCQ